MWTCCNPVTLYKHVKNTHCLTFKTVFGEEINFILLKDDFVFCKVDSECTCPSDGYILYGQIRVAQQQGKMYCNLVLFFFLRPLSKFQKWFKINYFHISGSKAMFYLAAAVSDFYIPASEMPEHKIQSSNGPLQVQNCPNVYHHYL